MDIKKLANRKKVVGSLVAALLALIGALYGVNVDHLQGTITDQIEAEIVKGEVRVQLSGVVTNP